MLRVHWSYVGRRRANPHLKWCFKSMIAAEQYEVGATRQFLQDLRDHYVKDPAVRTHIDSFASAAHDPFSRSNRPEKLFQEPSIGERYSIRLNDDFRVIFDKLDSKRIIYRALGKHDPTYRRAKRMGRIDLDKSLTFPMSIHGPEERRRLSPAREAFVSAVSYAAPVPALTDNEKKPEPAGLPTRIDPPLSAQEPTALSEKVLSEPCVFFVQHADLRKAMAGAFEEWMLFLPDSQRQLVTQRANGPSRIYGPSGTGKTCILLHRAVHLARHSCKDVLVLTFRPTLVSYLRGLIDRLCSEDPRIKAKIRVASVLEIATEISPYREVLTEAQQRVLLDRARSLAGVEPPSLKRKFRRGQSLGDFTFCEITRWVKGATNSDREDYETFAFPSGKTSLSSAETDWLFEVLAQYEFLKAGAADEQDIISLGKQESETNSNVRWSAVLVDEFQDLDLNALSFVGKLCNVPENLFFAGDHRQRIYQTLPSFARAGINIRGRSRQVTLNYRNSPQIYAAARAVLNGAGIDPDGVDREEDHIEFAQPTAKVPILREFHSDSEESLWVCDRIHSLIRNGVPKHHIAIISFDITNSSTFNWDADFGVLQLHHEVVHRTAIFTKGYVKRMTIHQAKGFEFPIVFLMGLTRDLFVSSTFIRASENPEDVVRALLYVAMTRARDTLFMSAPGRLLNELDDLDTSLVSRSEI
jgi:superfamily I DNA/RNA helicase/Txe/YoeB family toxin of Txe-Axe toxin-antitoxin module